MTFRLKQMPDEILGLEWERWVYLCILLKAAGHTTQVARSGINAWLRHRTPTFSRFLCVGWSGCPHVSTLCGFHLALCWIQWQWQNHMFCEFEKRDQKHAPADQMRMIHTWPADHSGVWWPTFSTLSGPLRILHSVQDPMYPQVFPNFRHRPQWIYVCVRILSQGCPTWNWPAQSIFNSRFCPESRSSQNSSFLCCFLRPTSLPLQNFDSCEKILHKLVIFVFQRKKSWISSFCNFSLFFDLRENKSDSDLKRKEPCTCSPSCSQLTHFAAQVLDQYSGPASCREDNKAAVSHLTGYQEWLLPWLSWKPAM